VNIEKVLSPVVSNMKPSGIRKFFDIVSSMPDAISLGVGEPDFVTPWHIRDAGIYSLEKGRTYYTSNSGLGELREEICRYLTRRFGLEYNPENEVLITVGGSEAIGHLYSLPCFTRRRGVNSRNRVLFANPVHTACRGHCRYRLSQRKKKTLS
jgi:aspartate/methionine/tyrosine aminotransferase